MHFPNHTQLLNFIICMVLYTKNLLKRKERAIKEEIGKESGVRCQVPLVGAFSERRSHFGGHRLPSNFQLGYASILKVVRKEYMPTPGPPYPRSLY